MSLVALNFEYRQGFTPQAFVIRLCKEFEIELDSRKCPFEV